MNEPWTTNGFNEMPYRILGKTGLWASNIGLGTWKFGYPDTGDDSRVDEKTAFGILDRAVDLGVTFWDTANRYNNASGNSERIIGKWFRDNPDQRRNIVLATKVFGGMDGITPNHSKLSRGNILDSVYSCLERLQTSHIDLLYFHAFDTQTPVEESLMAVWDLMGMDLVRYFAVSNFSISNLELYHSAGEKFASSFQIAAVQNKFDIITGENNEHKGVLEHCAKSGVSFVAYSPLSRGLLTDRYLDVKTVGKGDRLFDEGSNGLYTDKDIHDKLTSLSSLAGSLDMSLSQLALAYMLTLPGMGPVIPSSSTVAQLESNAAAGKTALDEETKYKIKNILGEIT